MLVNLSVKSFRLLGGSFFTPSKQLLRNIKFLQTVNPNSVINKNHYKLVYDFPAVKLMGTFMKIKLLIPKVLVAVTPVYYIFSQDLIASVVIMLLGSVNAITAYLISKFGKNLVGKIYVNKEGEIKEVLISSLTASGRRIDKIYSLNELIAYDFPTKIHRSMGVINIGTENSTVRYKVCVSKCKLIDPVICIHLFGNVWVATNNELWDITKGKKADEKSKFKTKKISAV